MLSATDIRPQLKGAWQLMLGRKEGLSRLDLSMQGLWFSFFAMVVAAPPLILSWVDTAHALVPVSSFPAERFLLIVRLVLVDAGTWVVPLLILAAVAPIAGLSDRLVPYVVASNWASAIFVWMMLPATLIALPGGPLDQIASTLALLVFALSLILTWRLTNAALDKGAAVATAVFTLVFLASLVTLFLLQSLLGIAMPPVPAG